MKKIFYYNFLPTRTEEEAAIARNIPHHVTRTLTEIREGRDIGPPPPHIDLNNPWQIRKLISNSELATGRFKLSHNDMFDHVFRYWTLDMANHVVMGSKSFVILFDYTDDNNMPKRYSSENTFVEKGPNDTYILGCLDLVRSRLLNPGDEIGLFWEIRSGTFSFKLLLRR